MTRIIVGCAGWSYEDWEGPFYPKHLSKNRYLHHYSRIFDFTEINATFYNLPSETTVKNWMRQVPEKFRFTVKVWQKITHESAHPELNGRIQIFFKRMEVLKPKINYFLLQFPPRFKFSEAHAQQLKRILYQIPSEKPIVLEFRNNSWFNPASLEEIVDGTNVLLATTYLEGVKPVYWPNQTIYYIRLIGDRTITQFTQVQRPQEETLSEIEAQLIMFSKSQNVEQSVIVFNNHFSGFAPQDVYEFKRRLGLPSHPLKSQQNLLGFI